MLQYGVWAEGFEDCVEATMDNFLATPTLLLLVNNSVVLLFMVDIHFKGTKLN